MDPDRANRLSYSSDSIIFYWEEFMPEQTIRTFLFGSCVGRDMYEMVGQENGLERVGTVARQSLVSAFHPAPTTGFDFNKIKSAFQKRMASRDFQGSLLNGLEEQKEEIDILIIDLIDERRGVMKYPDGGVFTPTIENKSALVGHYEDLGTQHLEFGTDAFYGAFAREAIAFKNFLLERNLFEKTLILDIPLALAYDKSDSSIDATRAKNHLKWAPKMNERLRELYQLLEAMSFPVAGLSDQTPLMSGGHRWGQAPYHYQDTIYELIYERVIEFVGRDSLQNQNDYEATED